jgi:hypothetical protein
MLSAQRQRLESFLDENIPFCIFTLKKHPPSFIAECHKVGYKRLEEWAQGDSRHFVEIDAGGLYMRFSGLHDYRRIRINELLEEPFDANGNLKQEYEARVYKPILLQKRDANGKRFMQLDRGLRVEYFEQPDYPELFMPRAVVD